MQHQVKFRIHRVIVNTRQMTAVVSDPVIIIIFRVFRVTVGWGRGDDGSYVVVSAGVDW